MLQISLLNTNAFAGLLGRTKILIVKKNLLTTFSFLLLIQYAFNQVPIAVADTAVTLNQVQVSVNVLLNDYHPNGDTIEIYDLNDPMHGINWYVDSIVHYKSDYFIGWDKMSYNVAPVGNPGLQSDYTRLHIQVLENPDVPVARNDTFFAKYLEPTLLDILPNDDDPNGDSIKIDSIRYTSQCSVEISEDSSHIIFTSTHSPYGRSLFIYRVIETNTAENYHSDWARVRIHLEKNNDLPVPVEDVFEATGGIMASLDVMENDHNPLNEELEIVEVTDPTIGSVSIEGPIIKYTAPLSYAGPDDFEYSIRYKNKPWLYSLEAVVNLNVIKNPACPVGEPDYGSGMAYTEIQVEVLSNDFDPIGDPFEICEVKTLYEGYSSISFSGDMVTYKPPTIAVGKDSAFYRIRKVNNINYYSEWIPIYYELAHNPDFPLCNPDSAITIAGIPVTIDIFENSIIHDTLEFSHIYPNQPPKMGTYDLHDIEDGILTYTPYMKSKGRDTIALILMNYGIEPYIFGREWVYIDIVNNHSYDSLNINNINAGISSNNILFTRRNELISGWYGYFTGPHFEVPKGSGKNTIFLNTMWIGGLNSSGGLHQAGQRYRSNGTDYQPGPIANSYDSAFLVNWQRTWKLTKEEVGFHRNNWWKDDYEPIELIAKWPGNGDPAYDMAEQLAPYYDNDGNGIYDPAFGDYPLIRGDQCIYFMVNDDKKHTETGGDSLQVEVHCMAYAYDAPADSILNNTIFVHYDLINRSQNTYFDTYFGVFTDFSIGYDWDDYVGSDVMSNSFLGYNGYNIDGRNDPGSYGENPPAQSTTFLAGPFLDADNEDNPSGACDESKNGVNFGNGIIDDERHGMSNFIYFGGAGFMDDPQIHVEYYQYLRAHWRDNTPLNFGGLGHYLWAPGPECRYMWPGDTDPYNWGTECVLPNDGYNQNGKWWTEEHESNSPGDRRGLGSCGPFTFHPGDVQEVELAYVFANSYKGADSSKKLLSERLSELRQRVLDGEIVIPNDELDINEQSTSVHNFKIYPNPASEVIYIETEELRGGKAEYRIISPMGIVIASGSIMNKTKNEINIQYLKPGFYIITVITENGIASNKFIKY